MPGHVSSTCGMPVELHVWISLNLRPHLDIWIRNVADTVRRLLLVRRNILFIRAKLNMMKYKCWPLHFRPLMGSQEKILLTENNSIAGLCDCQGMKWPLIADPGQFLSNIEWPTWTNRVALQTQIEVAHFQCTEEHTIPTDWTNGIGIPT